MLIQYLFLETKETFACETEIGPFDAQCRTSLFHQNRRKFIPGSLLKRMLFSADSPPVNHIDHVIHHLLLFP